MIQKIKIDWENCYGIKELNQEFKFTPGKQIHLIYAPNGSMKTSFAKTMRYLSGQSKEKPCDKLHDKDKSSFILKVDGLDVSKENIFVVNGDDPFSPFKLKPVPKTGMILYINNCQRRRNSS